jgi:hypothetical protein
MLAAPEEFSRSNKTCCVACRRTQWSFSESALCESQTTLRAVVQLTMSMIDKSLSLAMTLIVGCRYLLFLYKDRQRKA